MPDIQTPPQADKPESTPLDEQDVLSTFRAAISAAQVHRRTFSQDWKQNIATRLGQGAAMQGTGVTPEDDQSEINPDWSLSKTKTANLYSQVPSVQCTHENPQYGPAIPPFAKALNYELGEKRANVGVAMEEVLNDVINAAGIGAVLVGYAARFESVQVPAADVSSVDPKVVQALIAAKQMPMQSVQRVVSDKFYATRISPVDLLWPAEFTGSNFDEAPWVGYTGRMSWAEAKHEFNLTDDQKVSACGGADTEAHDDLRTDRQTTMSEAEVVTFDDLYYWRYRVDPAELSFKAIWRLTFVHGIDDRVKHEPWKGQSYDPQTRKYVGCCKFPIRILTLTYISDHPVPPSDTRAGRPQVADMRRSRSQMFQNRMRSIPIRWYDVNRIDPTIQETLLRGTWQGMIPTNGDGSRSIGEIARASYPSEDLAFDQQVKADLMESWQIGANQQGTDTTRDTTAAEIKTVQANFSTRIGQERARVASFFLGIAEVLAGWMCLYSDFPTLTDQERQVMQQAWNQKAILHEVVLKIRPDSTIVLDSQQRVQRLSQFLNLTAKSGFIRVEPIIAEIAELTGLNPSEVMTKPTPKSEEPNISYRFSGKDDLINPAVLALLIKSKLAPSLEDLQAAQKFLSAATQPSSPPGVVAGAPAGGPAPPALPPGAPPPTGQPSNGLPVPPDHDAHPDWHLASKIAQRSRDMASN